MRSITTHIVPFLLVLLLALISACEQWPSFQATEAPGLLTASGRIEGRITTVTPKSFGRMVELRVDEGQSVAAGDILVILDDETQRQRVQAAADNLRALQQRLRAADPIHSSRYYVTRSPCRSSTPLPR